MALPCWEVGEGRARLNLICFLSPRDKMENLKNCLSEPGLEVVPVSSGVIKQPPWATGDQAWAIGDQRKQRKQSVCEN